MLPGALAFGLLRALVAFRFGDPAGYALGLVCEPFAVFAAAIVALRTALRAGEYGVAERLLGARAGRALRDGCRSISGGSPRAARSCDLVPLWLVVAPPVLGIQIQAAADRLRRSVRRGLEARVAARTRELAASEERYRTITELASDFAFKFRIDRDGNLTREWIAGAFEATLGWRPEDLDGHGWLPPARARCARTDRLGVPEHPPGSRPSRSTAACVGKRRPAALDPVAARTRAGSTQQGNVEVTRFRARRDRAEDARSRRASGWRGTSNRSSGWRASAFWRAASRTTSTTC